MKLTPFIGTALASVALGSAAQAATIIGTLNFSSGPGGGLNLQDSAGNITTNLAAAVGIQSWLFPLVDESSGSFSIVPDGAAVDFTQPWIFTPSSPITPLWTVIAPGNFTFNLSSATIAYQDSSFLLISGSGTLTGTNFDATPGTWFFSTQEVATETKFSWSSSTQAVPEIGSTTLLSGALLGLCCLRRRITL